MLTLCRRPGSQPRNAQEYNQYPLHTRSMFVALDHFLSLAALLGLEFARKWQGEGPAFHSSTQSTPRGSIRYSSSTEGF